MWGKKEGVAKRKKRKRRKRRQRGKVKGLKIKIVTQVLTNERIMSKEGK